MTRFQQAATPRGLTAAAVFAVVIVATLAGCRDQSLDTPTLRLSVTGSTLAIRVENRTAAALQVPANFLDRSRKHELALAVASERGVPVAMCREVAYVDGADLRTVAPGTAGTVELDAATVMQTHCLEPGRTYRVQAVLVGGAQAGVSADVRSNPVMLTMNAPP